jgi:MraZ protein
VQVVVEREGQKGRVSVPALFRSALASQHFQGVVAYPSFVYPCIEACGMDRIERLSESIDNLDPFSEERDAFATSILGGCVQLALDGDGRILLPQSLVEIAGLDEQAVFVGKGQTFEIWAPQKFEEYAAKARDLAKQHRGALSLRPKNAGGAV